MTTMRGRDGRLTTRGQARLRSDIQRHLTRALAGTYDINGNLAMTLLETGLALVAIAELDDDAGRDAYGRVQEYLAASR